MIFKSRNAIGIRVMLITLFFFFMLTDAGPNQTVRQLEKKCGKSMLNITPNFYEMNEKEEVSKAAKYAIKTIDGKIKCNKCLKKISVFFAFVSFVMTALWIIVYFKNKFEHWIKPNWSQTNLLDQLHHSPKVLAYIFLILWVVNLLMYSTFVCFEAEKTAACKRLIKDIKYYEDTRINEIMTIKEEKEQVKVDEEIVKTDEEIVETDEAIVEIDEAIVETDEKNVESNYDAPLPEAPSIVVPPLSEKPKAPSVTIEATTQNPPPKKSKKGQTKKNRNNTTDHKNTDKKEIDQEDYYYFIYAIVFVFALFFICTLCNFEDEAEEKEGEIYDV